MPSSPSLPGIADLDVDEFLVRFRRDATPLMWMGVVLGSLLFALTPILTTGVPLPAFLLGEALRDKHAARIAGHPIYLVRQGIFVVRLAAGLCWGGHAQVRQHFALTAYPVDPGTFRTG